MLNLIDWNWVPPRDYIPVGTCYNTLYSETRIAQPTFFCYAGMDVTFFKYLSLWRPLCNKKRMQLMMLSIVSLAPPLAALAVPPCLFTTIEIFLKFGALRRKVYPEII